jgi:hypothetical protein
MNAGTRFVCAAAAAALLAACAAQEVRPVLYPNLKLRQAGEQQAQRDIDACIALAEKSGAPAAGASPVARGAAEGAAVGGATAAVGSAIRGGNVAEGAAAGAAIGGTAGAVHGAFRASRPDPLHRNFVQRCLRERGYEVIGWR